VTSNGIRTGLARLFWELEMERIEKLAAQKTSSELRLATVKARLGRVLQRLGL
jgi:hypothetical protein